MFHNILVKKKAILYQFRKGLSILGLLDEIQRKPEMFEECFVYQGIVSNDSVASSLDFPASEDKNAQRVYQLLKTFSEVRHWYKVLSKKHPSTTYNSLL